MIDMNASIESIMQECDYIAMNEFKGDAELGYAKARDYERSTHMHINGKKNHRGAVNQYSSKSDNSKNRSEAITNHPFVKDTRNAYKMRVRDNIDGAKNLHNALDRKRDLNKKEAIKESASIFDPLFDQI
jgi:hypothetical protein